MTQIFSSAVKKLAVKLNHTIVIMTLTIISNRYGTPCTFCLGDSDIPREIEKVGTVIPFVCSIELGKL
jgi:hypothetical protein